MRYQEEPEAVVVVDSDGCVLDSMETKHRKAFFSALDSVWCFGEFRDEAEELWLGINLYSGLRGANRFLALLAFFDVLRGMNRDEVGPSPRESTALKVWTETAPALSEAFLVERYMKASGDSRLLLGKTLEWTREVNRIVGTLPEAPVFKGASEALELVRQNAAPLYVVSSANRKAIETDWKIAGVGHLAKRIFGQEDGTKVKLLHRLYKESPSGKRMIMVGDSPGDHEAAREAGVLFFPIIPGNEEQSWLDFRKFILPQLFGEGLCHALLKPFVQRFEQVLYNRVS
ncbi:MAG TPA: HAD family hydrolase [Oceanipulchritudo sp.]|nr:HAD family hydrolase [Oceanipulchritudo sp.]